MASARLRDLVVVSLEIPGKGMMLFLNPLQKIQKCDVRSAKVPQILNPADQEVVVLQRGKDPKECRIDKKNILERLVPEKFGVQFQPYPRLQVPDECVEVIQVILVVELCAHLCASVQLDTPTGPVIGSADLLTADKS